MHIRWMIYGLFFYVVIFSVFILCLYLSSCFLFLVFRIILLVCRLAIAMAMVFIRVFYGCFRLSHGHVVKRCFQGSSFHFFIRSSFKTSSHSVQIGLVIMDMKSG